MERDGSGGGGSRSRPRFRSRAKFASGRSTGIDRRRVTTPFVRGTKRGTNVCPPETEDAKWNQGC